MGWRSRVQEQLSGLPKRTLLWSDSESGVDLISEGVRLHGLPTISAWAASEVSRIQLARILRAGVARTLGASFASSLDTLDSLVAALVEYQIHIGPIGLILGWEHSLAAHLSTLVSCILPGSSIVVVAQYGVSASTSYGLNVFHSEFLRLSTDEALDEADSRLATDDVLFALKASQGHHQSFFRLLHELSPAPMRKKTLENPPQQWPEDPNRIIDALADRGMWASAFDWACQSAPERLIQLLPAAGNALFNLGEHEYLLRRLGAQSSSIQDHPEVMYWQFAAACAVGRQSSLVLRVHELLAHHEAPQLRAVAALALPSRNMLAETSRALHELESPVTLRAHGYALGLHGEREIPIVMLEEAMRLADLAGAHHLVVACGVDIAQLELTEGRYAEAQGWARWSLSELERRRVRDESRRLSATATLAYSTLLAGDVASAQEALGDLSDTNKAIDVPGLELLVSSLGDLHFLLDDYDRSEVYYRLQFNSAPKGYTAHAAVDLVALTLAQGKIPEAERLSGIAFALSRSGSIQEQALGHLIQGLVLTWKSAVGADVALAGAMDTLRVVGQSFHIARAAIWIAIERLTRNDTSGARNSLIEHRPFLDQLSPTGWKLLAANHRLLHELLTLYDMSKNQLSFRFLGTQVMHAKDGDSRLSLRNAEILAILAANPSGLTAEKLHALQFGDIGEPSRTKVAVSRLRKTLPISSSPYRIEANYRADFVELLEHLDAGQVQAALQLYEGPLLPDSDAPAIVNLRIHVEEVLRQAVLRSNDGEALIQLGIVLDEDIEVWLAARASLAQADYRQAAISARVRRIRAGWNR